MKNKFYSAVLFLTVLALAFTACSQEPIFYNIDQEVVLSDGQINGNVISMVPLAGKIYTANGYLWSKDLNAKNSWKKIPSPAGISRVVRVVSDSSTLYVLSDGVGGKYKVFAATSTSLDKPDFSSADWENVKEFDVNYNPGFFDNGVFNAADGRNAYISFANPADSSKGITYKLNGTGDPVLQTTVTDLFSDKNDQILHSAASVSGTDYFSVNECSVSDGIKIYTAAYDSKSVDYAAPADVAGKKSISVGSNGIKSLFVSGSEIFVATSYGYKKISLSGSAPSLKDASEGNASASFGSRIIMGVWAYGNTDSVKHIYVASLSPSSSTYSKLWGYYGSDWHYE
ncbi:MAG: hypothetical protein MJ183_09650 [Treponemataceae bacterium]|nr:hypothetical protein [Treponemataceae bacterium]